MNPDHQRALACARHYRKLGLSPLPSRSDRKAPDLPEFAHFHAGAPIPDEVYHDDRWKASNIQVITGCKTASPVRVAVVDLDGDEAQEAWSRICHHHEYTPGPTWACITGSGGIHVYYRLPPGIEECPSGVIWGLWDTFGRGGRGGWAKHKEIRILGDGALAVAPPSIHVETGKRYAFDGDRNPLRIALPELAPDWLLAMPRLTGPVVAPPPRVEAPKLGPVSYSGSYRSREEVLAAIHDKVALAKSWGLAFERESPNPSGWCQCYVPGEEEPGRAKSPSGSFHAGDGTFQNKRDNTTAISLFDLGALLQPGSFADWKECKAWCADRFLGPASKPDRGQVAPRWKYGRPA